MKAFAIALGLLLGLLIFSASATASAEPRTPSEDAKRLAERGFEAYDEGDYEKAIELFERAHDMSPADGLLYNIAQAYRHLGDAGCAQALEYYLRYRDTLDEDGAPTPKRLKTRIAESEECASAQASERKQDSKNEPDADLSVRDLGVDEPNRIAARVESEPRRPRTAGWLVLGVGAASIAVSATTGLIARGRKLDLEDVCNEGVCAPSLTDEIKDYRRMRTTAIISGGLGIGALVAGSWLLLRSSSVETRKSGARADASIGPWIGSRTAGVQCSF